MGHLVQKMVVEDVANASPILPVHVSLVDASGNQVIPGNATTMTAGIVKKASAPLALAVGADIATVVAAYTDLVAKLKAADITA